MVEPQLLILAARLALLILLFQELMGVCVL